MRNKVGKTAFNNESVAPVTDLQKSLLKGFTDTNIQNERDQQLEKINSVASQALGIPQSPYKHFYVSQISKTPPSLGVLGKRKFSVMKQY